MPGCFWVGSGPLAFRAVMFWPFPGEHIILQAVCILHRCAFLAKQVHNQTVTRQNHKPKIPRLAVKYIVKLYIHWNSVEGLLKIGEFSLLEPIWSLSCGWLLILKDKFRLSWAFLFFLSWYKRKARFNLVLIWRSRWHGSVEDMCLLASIMKV